MTPLIDDWVLIVDTNGNYIIARYLGVKARGNGRTDRNLKDVRYYTSLAKAFEGLRQELERRTLQNGFPSLCEALRAIRESNERVEKVFGRVMDYLEGKSNVTE